MDYGKVVDLLPPLVRKNAYIGISLVGLVLTATLVGFAASPFDPPWWLVSALAGVGVVATPFGVVAASNVQLDPVSAAEQQAKRDAKLQVATTKAAARDERGRFKAKGAVTLSVLMALIGGLLAYGPSTVAPQAGPETGVIGTALAPQEASAKVGHTHVINRTPHIIAVWCDYGKPATKFRLTYTGADSHHKDRCGEKYEWDTDQVQDTLTKTCIYVSGPGAVLKRVKGWWVVPKGDKIKIPDLTTAEVYNYAKWRCGGKKKYPMH